MYGTAETRKHLYTSKTSRDAVAYWHVEHTLHGTPLTDIARREGLPLNTLKDNLHRFRRHLRIDFAYNLKGRRVLNYLSGLV